MKVSGVDEATHVYVALKECGCWSGVVTDLGDRFTARDVAHFIKSGLRVERISMEKWRTGSISCSTKCPHKPKSPKQEEMFT